MEYRVAVFMSRTQVLEFIERMKNRGIYCATTNNPAEARLGCGIAAKFNVQHMNLARYIIEAYGLNTFYAFYRIIKTGIRSTAERI